MHLFAKVSNIIHKEMFILYITLSNIFHNRRTKYATHLDGWSIISFIYDRLHVIVVIKVI